MNFRSRFAAVLTAGVLAIGGSMVTASPASAGPAVFAGVSLKPNRQGCVVETITMSNIGLTNETITVVTAGDGKQRRNIKIGPVSGKRLQRMICKNLDKRTRSATYNIRTTVYHQGTHEAEASFTGIVRQGGRG